MTMGTIINIEDYKHKRKLTPADNARTTLGRILDSFGNWDSDEEKFLHYIEQAERDRDRAGY